MRPSCNRHYYSSLSLSTVLYWCCSLLVLFSSVGCVCDSTLFSRRVAALRRPGRTWRERERERGSATDSITVERTMEMRARVYLLARVSVLRDAAAVDFEFVLGARDGVNQNQLMNTMCVCTNE